MRYVIDTTVLVRHLRRDGRAIRLFETLVEENHELWGAPVSRTEILAGMRPDEFVATYRLFDALKWMDITAEVADTAGYLSRRFRRSHPGIDTADFLVAAVAMSLNARILTHNVKHYPMYRDLKPPFSLP